MTSINSVKLKEATRPIALSNAQFLASIHKIKAKDKVTTSPPKIVDPKTNKCTYTFNIEFHEGGGDEYQTSPNVLLAHLVLTGRGLIKFKTAEQSGYKGSPNNNRVITLNSDENGTEKVGIPASVYPSEFQGKTKSFPVEASCTEFDTSGKPTGKRIKAVEVLTPLSNKICKPAFLWWPEECANTNDAAKVRDLLE